MPARDYLIYSRINEEIMIYENELREIEIGKARLK